MRVDGTVSIYVAATADGCNLVHTCLLVKRAVGEALLYMTPLGDVFDSKIASHRVSCSCLFVFILAPR